MISTSRSMDHLATDLPTVVCDAVRVELVLVNLCINARDSLVGSKVETRRLGVKTYRAPRSTEQAP